MPKCGATSTVPFCQQFPEPAAYSSQRRVSGDIRDEHGDIVRQTGMHAIPGCGQQRLQGAHDVFVHDLIRCPRGSNQQGPTNMRQTTLTRTLALCDRPCGGSVASLLGLLHAEGDLVFHAVIPHGNVLKCVSELLVRCAAHVPVTVDGNGIGFTACDPTSGRLIHIHLHPRDMMDFRFLRGAPLRVTLETGDPRTRPRAPARVRQSARRVPRRGAVATATDGSPATTS